MNGNKFLDIACNEAWKYQLLTYPNPAVGCVITDQNDKIITKDAHKRAGFAHAELEACKNVFEIVTKSIINTQNSHEITHFLYKNHNNIFKNLNIYVTLEPCSHEGKTPSCAKLLNILGFKNVIIGQKDTNEIAKDGSKILKEQNVIFNSHKNSYKLLYPFYKWQKDRFVFFKIALNKNHTYDTGLISNQKSRELVHSYRKLIDLLVIGGESVRSDRPKLDTRLADGLNPPDILILSKRNDFDNNIDLFNIPNRKVDISNKIFIPKDKKFVMIEGGYELFKATKHLCDYLVVFQSNKIRDGKVFHIPKSSTLLYQRGIEDDTIKLYSLYSTQDVYQHS